MKLGYTKITYNGQEMTLKEWAYETQIPYNTLYSRYKRGYSLDKVFSKESFKWNPNWIRKEG